MQKDIERTRSSFSRQTVLLILVLAVSLAGCGELSSEPAGEVSNAALNPTSAPASTLLPADTPGLIQSAPEVSLVVPAAAPPILDGTISPGEWDPAVIADYQDGSQLMMMHAEGVLYLAIRASAPEIIMANIFVQRGDQISILHSSAALGMAKYAPSGGVWNLTQNFTWRCRDTGFSQAAQAERDEFWQQEGWLAANARMGTPNQLEYQISLAEEITSMAVIFVQELVPIPFPVGLADACVQTYPQGLPEEMQFSVEDWVGLELVED
ncbi:MAG: hypothetical protein JW757_02145 [Anaerolineales bacterium]|nr:hypothetical protein [Anaerolineales bacterium]